MLAAAADANSIGFLEFPEDLGATARGVPASIWQLPQAHKLDAHGYQRGAFYQDHWADVEYKKPTAILTNAPRLAEEPDLYLGWPVMSHDHHYKGPLPQRDFQPSQLIGKDAEGNFNTTPSAAYPPKICLRFAHLLFRAWVDKISQEAIHDTPAVGVEMAVDENSGSEVPAPVTPPLLEPLP